MLHITLNACEHNIRTGIQKPTPKSHYLTMFMLALMKYFGFVHAKRIQTRVQLDCIHIRYSKQWKLFYKVTGM